MSDTIILKNVFDYPNMNKIANLEALFQAYDKDDDRVSFVVYNSNGVEFDNN